MSDVKWIKITTDIFDDEKILIIESMPEADSIIVIWFKLLTLAGKQNNNGVFLMSNRIAYTDEMLAAIFRRNLNTVRLALKTFSELGMIEIIENVVTIPNWNKHQTLDAYEKKKERDRVYQANRRATQRALISKSSSCQTTQSYDVAISDKEREEDIDIDNISSSSKGENEVKEEPQKQKKDLIEERFEAFWEAYPKKVGKGDARKKFHKIAPNEVLFNQMMDSLNKAKKCEQWVRDRGQYIPHPSTWLNQSRWEDEYDAPVLKTTAQELSEDEKWDNFYDRYR